MKNKIRKINSKLNELQDLRNQTDYNYLYDLGFDEWVLILCNSSGMFLTQSRGCYRYLTDNDKKLCKNIALIDYALLEADFKAIYGLYNIFINLYGDIILNSDDRAVDLFNRFIVAFDTGIEYYIECSRLIETVKDKPNAIIKNEVWGISEDTIKIKRGE